MFEGSITALLTPMRTDTQRSIDDAALQKFVAWQIDQGSQALVPCGTTGESPTLSHAEHNRVVELCVEAAAGKVPIIAGAGSNSTQEAIELARHAKTAGADAALVVTPYYNKPTQAGLVAHFEAIAQSVEIPLIVYNIPGRSVVDMTPETMGLLARLPTVVGVKDATGDPVRVSLTRATCGNNFVQLSGEDASTLPFLSLGGHGCISVTSNIAPKLCAQMHAAWSQGDLAKALTIHDRLMPLHQALFAETSPGPAKYAASLLGICQDSARLPLVPIATEHQQAVRNALEALELKPMA